MNFYNQNMLLFLTYDKEYLIDISGNNILIKFKLHIQELSKIHNISLQDFSDDVLKLYTTYDRKLIEEKDFKKQFLTKDFKKFMKMYLEKQLVYFKKRDGGKILLDVGRNCSLELTLFSNDYMKFYYRGSKTISIKDLNRIFKRSWKR